MDYTSDPDGPPSNEHPNQHDFEQLEGMPRTTPNVVEGRMSARQMPLESLRWRDGANWSSKHVTRAACLRRPEAADLSADRAERSRR
jgi:hypothetical protein